MTIREDPPPSALVPFDRAQHARDLWAARLAGAIANPGEWFRMVGDWHPTDLNRLRRAARVQAGLEPAPTRPDRQNALPKLPPGQWEFVGETVQRGTRKVIWARLIPDEREGT